MKSKKILFIITASIIIFFIAIYMNINREKKYQLTINDALDTVSDITIIDNNKKSLLSSCRDTVYHYDSLLSITNPESDVFKFNESHDGLSVSNDVLYILSECEKFYHDTNKSFDVTGGDLYEIWNEAIKTSTLPDTQKINNSKKNVGFEQIELDIKNSFIHKKNPYLKLNFGAVAKGYIADKIAEQIKNEKPKGALINLGGNIYAYGKNEKNKAWNIGIQNPNSPQSLIGTIKISNKFVITSGDYQRYAIINSNRYHHIIDANTGYPANTGIKSVTVIADNGMVADALSTSCFLVGIDKSMELLKKYNASAIFVTNDNLVFYSEELENSFEKTNDNFKYFCL